MPIGRYEEIFHENVVMTIEHLKLATGQPRESILRDLKNIGYYSSYNARGKFYTLDSTPEFDCLGLWSYRDAYFSARRTLLETAEYLVGSSDAGYSHDELRQILGIGIQNSLYQLAMANRVVRRRVGSQYIYFGRGNTDEQWAKRSAMPIKPVERKASGATAAQGQPNMDPTLVIDILVAVLRGHETCSAAYSYLHQAGSSVTAHQIAVVFRHYDIGKKNSPAQK